MMTDEHRYLTKGELAERCRVTPRTVERWMRESTCPPITRLGRRVLFAIQAVEAWEARKTAA
jgi:excisionase family DNA binding protein